MNSLSLYIYIYIYVFSPLTHSFSQLTHSTHSPYSYPIYSPIIFSKHSLTQYRYSISLNLHYQSFLIISLPTYSRRSLIQITLIHLAPNSLSLLSLSHIPYSLSSNIFSNQHSLSSNILSLPTHSRHFLSHLTLSINHYILPTYSSPHSLTNPSLSYPTFSSH